MPLATLIVVFGLQPGLLLDLVQGSVDEFLASARTGQAIPVESAIVVVIGLAVIVLVVVARTVSVALGRRRETAVVAQGGGA